MFDAEQNYSSRHRREPNPRPGPEGTRAIMLGALFFFSYFETQIPLIFYPFHPSESPPASFYLIAFTKEFYLR